MNLLKNLADTEKTPFYLFDLGRLHERIHFLKAVFPKTSNCATPSKQTLLLPMR